MKTRRCSATSTASACRGRATATGAATSDPPSKDFDPSKWGYPTWDHLNNWRLYWRYSQGLFAELGSHQVNAANWFLDAKPVRVQAMGGVYRFKDGREVPDHVFATFEYPGGITGDVLVGRVERLRRALRSVLRHQGDADHPQRKRRDAVRRGRSADASPASKSRRRGAGAALETSETKPAQAGGTATATMTAAAEHRGQPDDLAEHLRDQRVRLGGPLRHAAQLRPREGVALRELDDRRERSAEDRQDRRDPDDRS